MPSCLLAHVSACLSKQLSGFSLEATASSCVASSNLPATSVQPCPRFLSFAQPFIITCRVFSLVLVTQNWPCRHPPEFTELLLLGASGLRSLGNGWAHQVHAPSDQLCELWQTLSRAQEFRAVSLLRICPWFISTTSPVSPTHTFHNAVQPGVIHTPKGVSEVHV